MTEEKKRRKVRKDKLIGVPKRKPRTPGEDVHVVIRQIFQSAKDQELTDKVLDAGAGLSANHWGKIKVGATNPTITTLEALAAVVGLTIVCVPADEEEDFDADL